MKRALLILHQKRSISGEVGIKLKERGYSLDIRRPSIGDKLPENLNHHDIIVIFGGPMSANDDLNFIKYEIDWLKIVIESGKPFLGICLGAQMLVKHLGGEVTKNTEDLAEVGFYKIFPTEDGKNMFANQQIFYQWHNEGFNLPKDSILLATGDRFKNQAFKYNNCYALQFHPEVNFLLHLRWLFFVLLTNPKKLMLKGSQNIFYQLILRIRYNNVISNWLDNFIDNYLLKNTSI